MTKETTLLYADQLPEAPSKSSASLICSLFSGNNNPAFNIQIN